jgi:flagellar biosynthetic protein FlhB
MAEGGDQDPEQKTEDPSAKRLEDSRKKGQVVSSREVTSFLLLLALTFIVASFIPKLSIQGKILLLPFIEQPDLLNVDKAGLGNLLSHVTYGMIGILLAPLFIAFFTVIISNYLQHGHVWTVESMQPKLERISLIKGFKKLFSMKSLVEFLKGVIKIAIVSIAGWLAIGNDLLVLRTLPDDTIETILWFLVHICTKLMIAVCIAMFFIAILDYLYQRFEYMKNLRMTKQELKDEYKQQEGDPHIKQKLRQIRAERAKKRMMTAVPKSDVIITNPTHFAVALKYDNNAMQAPIVVAKGIDFLALTIRKIAEENDIPIVRNPPLARVLYQHVDIDQEIPVAHYKAVAEIISYVYKLKGRAPKRKIAG